jgi:hypothetical protein
MLPGCRLVWNEDRPRVLTPAQMDVVADALILVFGPENWPSRN